MLCPLVVTELAPTPSVTTVHQRQAPERIPFARDILQIEYISKFALIVGPRQRILTE